MMRTPTVAEIDVVELRVAQGKHNVQQSVDRTRSALHTAMTRPSTVAFVAIAAGFTSFLVARRRRRCIEPSPVAAASATSATRPGFLRALISRYEPQVLAYVLQQVTAAWQNRSSSAVSNTAEAPLPPDVSNGAGPGRLAGLDR